MEKERILGEIRRTATDGKPLGRDQFCTQTGIRETDWQGKHWARWSDAQIEAGFEPLAFTTKFDDEIVLMRIAELARKLGRIPTRPEMRMERRTNQMFPNDSVIGRRWSRSEMVEALVKFCENNSGYNDISMILESIQRTTKESNIETDQSAAVSKNKNPSGYVYLVKSGKLYKIGFSENHWRRKSELHKQTAEGITEIHTIAAIDDAPGIERYWHERFKEKRQHGEWFDLSAEDISAFKKRKFM